MKKTYVSIVWGTERTRFCRFTAWKKAVLMAAPAEKKQLVDDIVKEYSFRERKAA